MDSTLILVSLESCFTVMHPSFRIVFFTTVTLSSVTAKDGLPSRSSSNTDINLDLNFLY